MYDPDAVILPSRQMAVFRLTRKSKRAPRLLDDGRVTHPLVKLQPAPDTIMCAWYGVVPALTLTPTHGWTYEMLQGIKDRDMWKVGGWQGTERILDEREKQAEEAQKRATHDMSRGVADEMFLHFMHQKGSQVGLALRNGR